MQQEYTDRTNSTMRLLLNIYSYSYNSSGSIVLNIVATHILPFIYITNVIDMGDGYFVGISSSAAVGFYIDTSNQITTSNIASGSNGYRGVRIGTSDSVYCTWYEKYSIIYYNKKSNTVEVTNTGTRSNTIIPAIPYGGQNILEITQSSGKLTFNKIEFS